MNKEELKKMLSVLEEVGSHLDYCGWGDSWERECAYHSKLPERFEAELAALRKVIGEEEKMADELVKTLRDTLREGSISLIHHGFSMLQTACEYHNNFDHDCHHPDRDFSCVSCCIVNCPLMVEV